MSLHETRPKVRFAAGSTPTIAPTLMVPIDVLLHLVSVAVSRSVTRLAALLGPVEERTHYSLPRAT